MTCPLSGDYRENAVHEEDVDSKSTTLEAEAAYRQDSQTEPDSADGVGDPAFGFGVPERFDERRHTRENVRCQREDDREVRVVRHRPRDDADDRRSHQAVIRRP